MYIIIEIIAKENLNIANLMQNIENLLLKKYSTEFFDIAQIALEHVIKVCLNGGATFTSLCVNKV